MWWGFYVENYNDYERSKGHTDWNKRIDRQVISLLVFYILSEE
jgi:hypothetical protein